MMYPIIRIGATTMFAYKEKGTQVDNLHPSIYTFRSGRVYYIARIRVFRCSILPIYKKSPCMTCVTRGPNIYSVLLNT